MNQTEIQRALEEVQLVYIDNTPLDDPKPAPPYSFSKKELDLDSGRGLDGVMQRNVLEHHARTLDLTFNYLNGRQMSRLLNIIDKSSMQVQAFDPWTNSMQTVSMEVYHGDLNPKIHMFDWDEDLQQVTPIYEPITIQLVEY